MQNFSRRTDKEEAILKT